METWAGFSRFSLVGDESRDVFRGHFEALFPPTWRKKWEVRESGGPPSAPLPSATGATYPDLFFSLQRRIFIGRLLSPRGMRESKSACGNVGRNASAFSESDGFRQVGNFSRRFGPFFPSDVLSFSKRFPGTRERVLARVANFLKHMTQSWIRKALKILWTSFFP